MSAIDASTASFKTATTPETPRIAFHPHRALPWLLLPEGMPLQVLIETAPVRVPNTQPWFKGMVSQRGNLLPVFDLSAWAGLANEENERQHLVIIGLGAQACAMLCAASPTILSLGAEDSISTEKGELSPFFGRSYTSALGRACEFDIERWLATAALQIVSSNATIKTP